MHDIVRMTCPVLAGSLKCHRELTAGIDVARAIGMLRREPVVWLSAVSSGIPTYVVRFKSTHLRGVQFCSWGIEVGFRLVSATHDGHGPGRQGWRLHRDERESGWCTYVGNCIGL